MFDRKRISVAAAALAAAVVVPAASQAATPKPATLKGIVVARDAARGTLVVTSARGAVTTLRTTVHRRVGARVAAKGVRLADGTFRASAVGGRRFARTARVHAIVVRAASGRLFLSAGGSVFSIHLGRRLASAGGSGLDAGSVVDATLSIDPSSGSVQQSSVQDVGQSGLVPLEGTISSLATGTLVLAVEEGAVTTIQIPSSITLPSTIAVGDRVEVLTQVAAGAFTLVTIQDDHQAAVSGQGTNMSGDGSSGSGSSEDDQGEVEAEGAVTALSATSITVQGGEHASSLTFAIPAGFTLPAVQVGDPVDAKGTLGSDGTITLVRLEAKHEGEGGGPHGAEVEAEGSVTAVSATSLTIQPNDGGAPVVFVVPSGMDVSAVAVGDAVSAKGTRASDGTVTLVKLEAQGSDSGSSSGDSSSESGSSGDSGSGDH